MKKIFFIISLTTIILSNSFYTANAEENCFSYSNQTGFGLYKERVRCICKRYEPEKAIKIIEDKFDEIENGYYLPSIKSTYKTNMNDIYKCAILGIQKKSLLLIKEELINVNPDLLDSLGSKIDEKVTKIKLSLSKFKCIDSNEKTSIQKLNVLNQVTYETCKYVNYLEYLKEKNQIIKTLIKEDKDEYSLNELYQTERIQNSSLDEEINHAYKVFPIAFHAYSEYENNIIIHFLLELLKEDYLVIREKLHKTLNPINQVVYKISNAMRKE